MKNILLIGSELGKGGAERSLSYLSYFLEQDNNVILCILSGTNRQRYYPTCAKVHFVDPPPAKGILQKIRSWRYRLKAIRELKASINCDVSISFLEGPNYVNVLTRGKEKVILSVRGSKYFDQEISGFTGWLRKKVFIPFLYPKADKIVCASRQLADELHTYFKVPRSILGFVYNIYDAEQVRKMAAEPLSGEEAKIFSQPVIVHSGRMHQQKRQDHLLRLFARVRQTAPARLLLLGDGELKAYYLEIAAAEELSVCDMEGGKPFQPADVYLLGYQSNPFRFYAHSRLFVLCSGWEGFPNVLAEALICRMPVLAADCPTGPREIMDVPIVSFAPTSQVHRTKAGSLMPMLDAENKTASEQWVNEIEFWIQQPNPGPEVFDRLTQRFTKESVLQAWLDYIHDQPQPRRSAASLPVCIPLFLLSLDSLVIFC